MVSSQQYLGSPPVVASVAQCLETFSEHLYNTVLKQALAQDYGKAASAMLSDETRKAVEVGVVTGQ